MKNKKYTNYVSGLIVGLTTLAVLAIALPASAQTTTPPAGSAWGNYKGGVGVGIGVGYARRWYDETWSIWHGFCCKW